MADHRPGGVTALLAVALGGALGTAGRYAVSLLLDPPATDSDGFPWDTLTVNLTGAGLLGVLVGVLLTRPDAPVLLRPFAGTGMLGGFTTYSALAVEVVARSGDQPLLAGVYLAVSVSVGVLAALAGIRLGASGFGRGRPALPGRR